MKGLRIGFFSDVHGNLEALKRVLEAMDGEGLDQVYCLGDLVGYGPRPNEVVETLKRRGVPIVMGNYDEGVGFELGECGCAYSSPEERKDGEVSLRWTTETVSKSNKEFLRGLPRRLEVGAGGLRLLLVHGSPRRINEYLYEERPLERVVRGLGVEVLVCGHTHKPYHRLVEGVHVVNDGSVGRPKDGDWRACYAVVEVSRGVEVEFRRVEYPVDEVAREIVEVGLPERYANSVLRGR